MHTTYNRRYKRIAPALVAVSLFFIASSASAALITVEPTVTRMTVLPGWEWLGSVRISNPGTESVHVEIGSVNLVSGTNTDGPPAPLIDEADGDRDVSLAGWLRLPVTEVSIAPGSVVEIPVGLVVPPYAGHGLHRAAVTVRQEGLRPEGVGAQVAATIAAGFAVDVIGTEDTNHDVRIVDFSTNSKIVSQFPVDVHIAIENHGTTLGVLDGSVKIDSLIGLGGVSFEVATPQEGRYLIPSHSYENTFSLSHEAVGSRAGLYRARVSIENGGNVLEESTYFVVVPLPLAIGLFFVLIVSIVLIRLYIRSVLRRRKR